MQIIESVAALDAVADTSLRPILERYRELLELAKIFILESGDTLDTLQQARGWPFVDWEFIHRHASGWFEAVFVFGQDGEGHIVVVPDTPEVSGQIRHICAAASEAPES